MQPSATYRGRRPGALTGVIVSMMTLAVAACGPARPVGETRAFATCSERARLADGVAGTVGIGAGSGGLATDLNLTVTNNVFRPRDPQIVYEQCFFELTGAGPTRPLPL